MMRFFGKMLFVNSSGAASMNCLLNFDGGTARGKPVIFLSPE
jgi:hypothetical protein